MRPRVTVSTAFAIFLLAACARTKTMPDAADADPSLLRARGEYITHCSACHGRNGAGAPKLYPPLTGESWALRSVEAAVRVVLHGLEGELVLMGERYMNKMPPLGERLMDDEIARVLTYVRGSWGNAAPAVTAEEVALIRALTFGREKPWSPPEIERFLSAATGDTARSPE
jgi:mono/diheme cytochrome c family protein